MIVQKYTLEEVLQGRWWIGLLAFGAALVFTPLFRWIAYRHGIVDRPDALLKSHAKPTAYLGGLGICSGLLVGLVVYGTMFPEMREQWGRLGQGLRAGAWLDLWKNPAWNLMGILVGSITITLLGLWDDIRNIKPWTKVLGQVLAAAALLVGGIGTHILTVFFHPFLDAPEWLVVILSAPLCLMMVISTCNAANLLDGLDGLCSGVTAIIALGFLALATWLASWGRYEGTDELRVVLSLAMAGAILGFLPYNVPPASIFMGDAGSMLLGFFVAVMMALFCQEGPLRWLMAACVVFSLPILDTALAVVRRVRSGVGIFTGDRSHLYDQLVDRGMSVPQVVVLFYALALASAVLGVTVAIAVRTRFAVIIYAVVLVLIWTLFAVLGMIAPAKKLPPADEEKPESQA